MSSERQSILWVDDEIDLLRPHILYLEDKGYRVTPVTNGHDALNLVENEPFDIVLLDEMMPGMGGLEVLEGIKARVPRLPVIMITKSEEEHLMDEALGHKISDYLIKPVNPSQIFLACKKIFEAASLERGTTVRNYVRERGTPSTPASWEEWTEQYVRSVLWDLELDRLGEAHLRQSHQDHLDDLNRRFGRFIEASYRGWVAQAPGQRPLLAPDIVPRAVVPLLKAGEKVTLIVIDCLRLDEWFLFESHLSPDIRVERDIALALLPTATAYGRNAIFSGLWPSEIARSYPEFWSEALRDTASKNRFERQLLRQMLKREGIALDRVKYSKIVSRADAEALTRQMGSFAELDLVALVFTFVDTFTHGRSRDALIAEFAQDVGGLRAHLRTWFERSVVHEVIEEMARQGRTTLVTTDHGSIQVRRATLVRGDREISPGVRFKYGKAPNCSEDEAVRVRAPEAFGLPAGGILKNYLFAKEDFFFVYAAHRHEYERQLRGSFQHGGISMEEMILPFVTLRRA